MIYYRSWENDGTLYSCIFVNGEWCKVSMEKFLENKILYVFIIKNIKHYLKFKCFNDDDKEFLKISGINYLIEDNIEDNNEDNNINSNIIKF